MLEKILSRWPLLLLLVASLVRILWIGSIPGGLNQDEASTGYDAWALLSEGIDRHGVSWPIHFIAWGSGQNALYAYLSMPFIALLGPSVFSLRLAAAILGIITLILFWLEARKKDPELGHWALIILATSPWHIMASRWALESNAAPAIIMIATYLFLQSPQKPRLFMAASAVLSLSVYAYGTCYFFAPLFMLAAWLLTFFTAWNCSTKEKLFYYAKATAISFLLTLPLMIFLWNNSHGTGHIHLGPITIPKYPSEARYSGLFLPLAENGWSQIPDNIKNVFELWLAGHSDGLPWNASNAWGPQYWWLTPFLIIGTIYSFTQKTLVDRLMLAWLSIALITAFCTSANINRINLIWIPSLWLIARGLWHLHLYPVVNKSAKIICLGIGFIFCMHYFANWKDKITENFYPGFEEAITEILKQASPTDHIAISTHTSYTLALYFARPSPHQYVASVEIPNRSAPFQSINKFTRFTMGASLAQSQPTKYWVAHISELASFDPMAFSIKTFGQYAAVVRKSQEEMACINPLPIDHLTGTQDWGNVKVNGEVGSGNWGLNLSNQIFPRGFGVHGDSRWSTTIEPSSTKLQIGFGIAQSSACSDGMTFRIEADDNPLFDSGKMIYGELRFVNLPLNGVKKLTFITLAGQTNQCDHGLWVNPTLSICPK